MFVSKNWLKKTDLSQNYYVFQNVQHHLLNCHQNIVLKYFRGALILCDFISFNQYDRVKKKKINKK